MAVVVFRVDDLGCSLSGFRFRVLEFGFVPSFADRGATSSKGLRVEVWSIIPGFHAHLLNRFTYIYICTYNMYIVDICRYICICIYIYICTHMDRYHVQMYSDIDMHICAIV